MQNVIEQSENVSDVYNYSIQNMLYRKALTVLMNFNHMGPLQFV